MPGTVSGFTNTSKSLHMNDYKKFKRINQIESRYVFGKTLG